MTRRPLALAVLTVACLAAVTEASAAREVVAHAGDLATRPAGLPATTDPARQIESATVRQDLKNGTIGGTVTLRARATAATDSDLVVEFGRSVEGVCQGDEGVVVGTAPGSSSGASYSGRTIKVSDERSEAETAGWNCAFAALNAVGTTDTYDALVGDLTDVLAPPVPKLKIGMKTGRTVKPGRWVKHRIKVSNPGTGTAREVKLKLGTRRAKAKPRRLRLGNIAPGKSRTRTVKVKLTSKKAGRVVVRAVGRKAKARRTLTLRPKIEARPGKGGYFESSDGRVNFTITPGGYLTGFRIFLQVRCGIFPGIPTTTFGYYDFPTVKIPRNGRIDARDKGELYTTRLEATVDGNRVKDGYFSYNGPHFCSGSDRWTARPRN